VIHTLYWIIDVSYIIVLAIILRQAYVYRDVLSPVDRSYRVLLSWVTFFCFLDTVWGIAATTQVGDPSLLFVLSSLFHISTVATANFWLYFVLTYLQKEISNSHIYKIIGGAIAGFQIILVAINCFTPTIFSITEDYLYKVEPLRYVAFINQYIIYFGIGIMTAIAALKKKDESRKTFFSVFMFVLAPVLCGAFQLLYPEYPFHSIGYFIGCCIIHIFIAAKERNDRLVIASTTDSLTNAFNRNAYEEDFKKYRNEPIDDDLIIFSIDINGLKQTNDTLGHLVGDELIIGSGQCISNAFAGCGKVYRVGGDEFMVVVHYDGDGSDFKSKLIEETLHWQGEKAKEISLSIGYAEKSKMPNASLIDLKKAADKMMYADKDLYYQTKGVDRRGQREAFDAICHSYTKILKVNLTSDSYKIIQIDPEEKDLKFGFAENISTWLRNFGLSGQVHPDDLDNYLNQTNITYLRNYFKNGCSSIGIFYRRRSSFGYNAVMLEMLKADDYTDTNQSMFLYLKDIGNKIVYA